MDLSLSFCSRNPFVFAVCQVSEFECFVNFDWGEVRVFKTYTFVPVVLPSVVRHYPPCMKMSMDVHTEPTKRLGVDWNVTEDHLVLVGVELHNVRPDVIEERKVLAQLEDVMIAFNEA